MNLSVTEMTAIKATIMNHLTDSLLDLPTEPDGLTQEIAMNAICSIIGDIEDKLQDEYYDQTIMDGLEVAVKHQLED